MFLVDIRQDFFSRRWLGLFWPTLIEKHHRLTLVKKKLANVSQYITPIDVDRKTLVDVNKNIPNQP